MKIIVIGGGGREYAIIKRLSFDSRVDKLYALPGNGGISRYAECVNIAATDIEGICQFAKTHCIDFAVVTPDDPLAMGASDRLRELGIQCFGPSKAAAMIESSKVFAKRLMAKYGIPTARSNTFCNIDDAKQYANTASLPIVIKADGLALGKGVVIAKTREQAIAAIDSIMGDRLFGAAGDSILIEEYLEGTEVSALAFTDGATIIPLVSSMDHKSIGENGEGANTGGMGAIAPNPYYTEEVAQYCMEHIYKPTIAAMSKEGRPFTGCLYFGLMLTHSGAYVIEYNCRFGDPETQTVLPLLKTNLLDIMLACENNSLSDITVEFEDAAVCCVALVSGGYPAKYRKGIHITLGDHDDDVEIIHAGTALSQEGYVTNGGRVLNVVAKARSLTLAVERAYNAVNNIKFENMYYRKDIGRTALAVNAGD